MFLDFCCMCRFITACFLVLECMFFFRTRMFPDFGIQWCFASWYSMTLLLCGVLHPDIPWLCYYVFALHPDIPWLWYNVLFYTPIFRDFITMYCFISGYSVTLLLCGVLYPDIPWLCYYVLLYILIFHDFVTMCLLYIPIFHDFGTMCCSFYIPIFRDFITMYCFISGYSVTLLLCVVLYYGFSLLHIFSLVLQPWMSAYIRKTDGVYISVPKND
jgi:hypothetical protein